MSDFQEYLDKALANVNFEDDKEEVISKYDIVREVNELLIRTRTSMDMSQKELSQKTGIPQANISKIETGRTVPSIPVLKRLADGLGKRLIIDFIEEEEE